MSFDSDDEPRFDHGTDGLLPVIVQNADGGAVLMSAWMNQQAWQETLRTGFAVYYSRSSRSLWRKGQTGGSRHKLVDVHVDCDANSILLQVEPIDSASADCAGDTGADADEVCNVKPTQRTAIPSAVGKAK